MLRIGKSAKERQQIEQMAAAVARYTGPVQYCRPGIARCHEKRGWMCGDQRAHTSDFNLAARAQKARISTILPLP